MVKTRVHDLAAEFGVAPEQLLSMLKDMNIFVRSHLSALEGDQVSRHPGALGAREAEERRRAHRQEGPPQGGQGASPRPRRLEAKPAKRRRTAAEVAQVEAQAEAEKAAELAALELERPIVELEEPVTGRSRSRSAPALCSRTCPPLPVEPEAAAGGDGRGAAVRRGGPASRCLRAGRHRDPARPPRAVHSAADAASRRRAAPRGPKPVFSSSAPSAPVAAGRRLRGLAPRSRPGPHRGAAPPARTFGPDAEKGGGRKKGKKGKR